MAKGKNNQATKTRKSETHNTATRNQQLSRQRQDPGSWLPAPGNLVRRFRDEMDRLFEDFGFGNLSHSLPTAESLGLGMWAPEVEIFEREGQMVVRADLPGLTRDDIKIDLTDSAISIDGERKQEHEESEHGYYRSERSYGRFYRRIPLPEGVNIDTAKAQFREGVLEVTFATPERAERKARKLEIADESSPAKARAAAAR